MLKIVHLTTAHSCYDARIFNKECKTLVAAGHDVTLIAPGALDVTEDGIRLAGIPRRTSRLGRMTLTLFDAWRAARARRADIYHFHDPELIVVGLLLKLHGHAVVYDVHENLPDQVMVKSYLGPAWVRRSVRALARGFEAVAARNLDGFCVAAPSIQARFPADKTVLVRNFVQLSLADSVETSEQRGSDGRPVLIYPGSLSRARGVATLIDAIEQFEGRAELWLFGKWHSEALKKECFEKPGWRFTRYFGRVRQEVVIAHIKAADFGVHLPPVSPNYSDGLAVKGFELLACRKTFVTTDEPGKRRTFDGCASFADAESLGSVVAAIRELIDNRQLRDQLARTGRERVESEYCWERESEKLLSLYARFDTRTSAGSPE